MVLKNTFPICFLSKNKLLVYKRLGFQAIDLYSGQTENVLRPSTTLQERFLNRIPLLIRLLRKGVRVGMKVDDNLIIVLIDKTIYELDLQNKGISDGYTTPDNSRPLIFSKIDGINGFDDGIYFGGYKGNPYKESVSIFKRIKKDCWIEVFQFGTGEIEHIHNIIADPYKNIVYILTGDFGKSAGIWKAENGFKSVTPLLRDDQNLRGCVGFPTTEGLLYATDSPFSNNSIRLLIQTESGWKTMPIRDINGPSIYGCMWKDDYVFSTSVEGDGRNVNTWYKLFGYKKGDGIIETSSFVYKGNLQNGFKQIYKVKKDCLPFYLFQFGVLMFPTGKNDSEVLPTYHIATIKNSMHTLLLNELTKRYLKKTAHNGS